MKSPLVGNAKSSPEFGFLILNGGGNDSGGNDAEDDDEDDDDESIVDA
jgi:hypothetical protein